MGCNCGGGGNSSVRSRNSGVPDGILPNRPFIMGDDGVYDLIRVRIARKIPGLVTGQAAWVRGSLVEENLSSGLIVRMDQPHVRARMWRVGSFTYTDHDQALRVASATNQTVEEI